jgi:hypothetical protein
MTVEMTNWAPPNGLEVLQVWLSPLGECRTEKPTNSVLPFIMVARGGGNADGLVDNGKYSIHVFHETEAKASTFCTLVHRRMEYLAGRFTGQQRVTISTGDVYADNVYNTEYFRKQKYVDDGQPKKIYQMIGLYEVDFRYVAAS